MLFSRIAAPIALFLSLGSSVFSAPTADAAIAKRATTSQVETVLETLQASTQTILPQISSLTSSGTATDENIVPLLTELLGSVNTATSSLKDLSSGGLLGLKRQSLTDVGGLLSGILSSILSVTGTIPTAGLPASTNILSSLLPTLTSLLSVVVALLPGVLGIVTGLLGGLGGGLLSGLLGGLLGGL